MRRLFAFFKDPPVWFVAVWDTGMLALVAASVILSAADKTAPAACAVYALAALSLVYAAYTAVRVLPRAVRDTGERMRRSPAVDRFLRDYGLRTFLFAGLSFLFNAAYVVGNVAAAVIYSSAWYWSMAAYYFSLGCIRAGVILAARQAQRKYPQEEVLRLARERIFLGCGIALLASEAALAAAIVQITFAGNVAPSVTLAVATAAYTFYRVAASVFHFVRARRRADRAVQCLRNLNVVAALVSLYSLEIVLSRGGMPAAFHAVVGAGVCAVSLALGVYMTAAAARTLGRARKGGFAAPRDK